MSAQDGIRGAVNEALAQAARANAAEAEVAALRAVLDAQAETLRETLDECEGWMSVAGMDGADPPTPEDFERIEARRRALAVPSEDTPPPTKKGTR